MKRKTSRRASTIVGECRRSSSSALERREEALVHGVVVGVAGRTSSTPRPCALRGQRLATRTAASAFSVRVTVQT